MHEIKTDGFQGPLSLLLELIEAEKLDITTVSLAHVTDQYLLRLSEREGKLDAGELADFLVVAAKLLLIKSRVLLPAAVYEDEEAGDLERALKMYKAYRDAMLVVREIIGRKRFSFPSQRRVAARAEFRPPENITPSLLARAMRTIIAGLEASMVRLPKKTLSRIVTISERIRDLRQLLSRAKKVGFGDFLKTARNKSEIIVSFLALLELVKQQSIVAAQEQGSDIVITPSSV